MQYEKINDQVFLEQTVIRELNLDPLLVDKSPRMQEKLRKIVLALRLIPDAQERLQKLLIKNDTNIDQIDYAYYHADLFLKQKEMQEELEKSGLLQTNEQQHEQSEQQ